MKLIKIVAVYINITKVKETNDSVIYDFGDGNKLIGKVLLKKSSGKIQLLEINQPDRQDFYFFRVTRKLLQHHQNGEYPEVTCYAA